MARIVLTATEMRTEWRPHELRLIYNADAGSYAIAVVVRDDLGELLRHDIRDAEAQTLMQALNTADLSQPGGSLWERVLDRLVSDGVIEGTVEP